MDRLNPQARRNIERNAARKTLGDTAMAEALHRALQAKDNPACRLKWRTPSGHVNLAAKRK